MLIPHVPDAHVPVRVGAYDPRSAIQYPAIVVGVDERRDHGTFPVVIFDQSRDGISDAESVDHPVTFPCASVVTLVYVHAVPTLV